jgi:hypothetical protein
VIKGMRINRHNELVRVLRDAILHSKKGNAKVYADLVATRDDTIIPQVTHEEWDFEAHDSGSEQTLRDTAPAQIALWRLLKTPKLRVRCSLTVRLGLSALERKAYHRSHTYARVTTLMRKTTQHPCARAGLSTSISSATDE